MTMEEMPTASFVCRCGEEFTSEQALQEHAREAHGAMDTDEVAPLVCPECQASFGTPEQLAEHQGSHGTHSEREEQFGS
ncbi:MAG TPA: C2H2-type zinc finger protein [Actinomycetota bacterium]|nr:C2H2-type zinc finger protein [Actinomycetota bacterium]